MIGRGRRARVINNSGFLKFQDSTFPSKSPNLEFRDLYFPPPNLEFQDYTFWKTQPATAKTPPIRCSLKDPSILVQRCYSFVEKNNQKFYRIFNAVCLLRLIPAFLRSKFLKIATFLVFRVNFIAYSCPIWILLQYDKVPYGWIRICVEYST